MFRLRHIGCPIGEPHFIVIGLCLRDLQSFDVEDVEVSGGDGADAGGVLHYLRLFVRILPEHHYPGMDEDTQLRFHQFCDLDGIVGAHVVVYPVPVRGGDRQYEHPAPEILFSNLLGIFSIAEIGNHTERGVEPEPHVVGVAVLRPADVDLHTFDIKDISGHE